MKKVSILLTAIMIMAGSVVMAQDEETGSSGSSGIEMMAGVNLGYSYWTTSAEYSSASYEEIVSFNQLSFGAFFDATYVRAGLNYTTTFGNGTYEEIQDDKTDEEVDIEKTTYAYIDIYALGKYPFDLGMLKIWPAVGIEYGLNIIADIDGTDVKDDSALSDFYILAGVGVDINATDKIVVTPSFIFGYNLTANTQKDDLSGFDYSGYKLAVNIGVGYKF